jgi:ABC-type transporter Mla maintaining outer membrane lipid asymmetry ATPase subunit MlaF
MAATETEAIRDLGGSGGEVELRALCKSFDDVTAVDSIDLDVVPGEFFSLLGPRAAARRRRCA